MLLYKTITANGDKINVPFRVCGDAIRVCHNAQVEVTIPDGVLLTGQYVSSQSNIIKVPKGFYNKVSNIWFVGDLDAEECVEGNFEFTINDISLVEPDGRFYITQVLTTACPETIMSDNVITVIITVGGVCSPNMLSIGVGSSEDCGASVSIG